MKSIIKLKKSVSFWGIFLVLLWAASCDNSNPEKIEVNRPTILEIHPALYQKYLQDLRAYKAAPHKAMILSFDNHIKESASAAYHINAIPDSVDYVSLMYPAELSASELEQMDAVRTNKGTKFIFTIHYDSIDGKYRQMQMEREQMIQSLEEGDEEPEELPSFETYLTKTLNDQLPLTDQFKYDGICFGYNGKSTRHMTQEVLTEYTKNQNTFIDILKDWYSRNNDKVLFFKGKPQNLLDKSFLESCKYIITSGAASSAEELDYTMSLANVEGVPSDRFVAAVETASLDPADDKTGIWADGTAIEGAALWAASEHENYTSTGLSVYHAGNDYYLSEGEQSSQREYDKIRNAIYTMNPSIKK